MQHRAGGRGQDAQARPGRMSAEPKPRTNRTAAHRFCRALAMACGHQLPDCLCDGHIGVISRATWVLEWMAMPISAADRRIIDAVAPIITTVCPAALHRGQRLLYLAAIRKVAVQFHLGAAMARAVRSLSPVIITVPVHAQPELMQHLCRLRRGSAGWR